ncbi:Ribonuclease T2 [Cichlidogyrus casuarinus]|uniref:Ribonuclease T2 n=1 Tax=Cichlidogyrus casuarinus TaxID=1844966 RepID=A0ABD2QC82_9PLAT
MKRHNTDIEIVHWDYLVLHQVWPPGHCSTGKCRFVKQDFLIGGLWAILYPGKRLENCGGAPYYDAVKSHEWYKFGACMYDRLLVKDAPDYFNLACSLKKRCATLDKLKSAGFIPSSQVAYSSTKINEVLNDVYRRNVKISCRRSSNDKQYLQDIRICYNHALNMIDCPKHYPRRRSVTEDDHEFQFRACRDLIYIADFDSQD